MAHCIEETDLTFSTKGPEWHGLANVVESINCETIQPILKAEIVEVPNFVPFINGGIARFGDDCSNAEFRKAAGKKLFVNLSHRKDLAPDLQLFELANASETYETISNAESFDFFETVLNGLNAPIVTAGTLKNNRVFYVSAEDDASDWKGPRNDVYKSHLNLVTSHDGTIAFTLHDSTTRIVCMNTLKFSMSQNETSGKIRQSVKHTKNAKDSIEAMATIYNQILLNRAELGENLELFDAIPCDRLDVEGFSAFYFLTIGKSGEAVRTDAARAKLETMKLSTRGKNQVDSIADLFKSGEGNRGATAYDLFNGATDHWTNGDGTGMNESTTKAQRWAKSEYGAASVHKSDFTLRLIESVKGGTFEADCESGKAVIVNSLK